MTKRILMSAAAVALLGAGAAHAQQEAFPSRNMVFVVAFQAGSSSDAIVRFMADKIKPLVKHTIVVENRPGASGAVATEYTLRSKPDGHTIFVHSPAAVAANDATMKTPPADTRNRLQVAATINRQAFMLAVHTNTPYKTLADLTAAMKKKGSKGELRAPVVNPASLSGPGRSSIQPYVSPRERSAATRSKVADLKAKIRRLASDDAMTKALKLLQSDEVQRLFDEVEIDQSYAVIAQAWFYAGEDAKALELAAPAAERSGNDVPLAHWIAGLSAWRLGDFDRAARHFERVALSDRVNDWLGAGGAYWAARAHLRRRDPAEMSYWLSLAAEFPRTFYGLLAREALGLKTEFDFRAFQLTADGTRRLAASPTGSRAVALLQVGQHELAEGELLQRVWPHVARECSSWAQVQAYAGRHAWLAGR